MASVPLRTSADTAEKVQEMMERLESIGRDLAVVRAVANAETAFVPFVRFAAALMQRLEVPARTRELVIMRCAAKQGSRYEWAEHFGVALDENVTREELAAFEQGMIPDSLTEQERLYLAATDEFLDHRGESADGMAAVAKLRAQLDDRTFTEFTLILGWWAGLVPTVIQLLDLDADRPPLPAAG